MDYLVRKQPPVFPIEKVVIPEALSLKLNNGIPLHLIEAGTEEIMRIEFSFRAGQVKEYIPLLASTTNMMLTEGSENYSSEELNRLLDFYGAFINLYAEKDRAGVVIFFLNNHIEKILELSREILFRPVFPDAELGALMKKRFRWFLVNREKVQNVATDKFFESVFGKDHPYGHQPVENDFDMITPLLLKDFHSKYYTPENMAILISGKIHPKSFGLLNDYFGDLSSKSIYNEANETLLTGEKRKKVHIEKTGTVQTSVRIGSATINKRHPDYHGIKILDTILGGYFGSRLMKNIREEKGYTYGISSSVASLDLTGYKVISTEVAQKNLKKTVDEIFKELNLLQTIPVKSEEMSIVRNYMSGEMVRMFDGPFALAESFMSVWAFGLDNLYYYKLYEKINTIEPDEILALARTYYNIEELYMITVGTK